MLIIDNSSPINFGLSGLFTLTMKRALIMPRSDRASVNQLRGQAAQRRPPPESKKPDDFVSLARQLESDEDKGLFEAILGIIAKVELQATK